mmetsp:Transcript_15012/g.48154  ORF Transcript_15012/g.48154 Transcript_15012/m.48154 type:complete len:134 (-) Transcript_15012:7-408(-)
MSDAQVAKVIARCPQMFGLSLDRKLKPLVYWLSEIGMSDAQVAKAIATCPSLCGLSLPSNLMPKVQLLHDVGFSDAQIASTLTVIPALLTYSSKRLAHRLSVLQAQGVLTETSMRTCMKMNDAKFAHFVARFD